jgi:hypothetical protein
MKDATHKDEYGNFYKVLGDKPQEYCVYFWNWPNYCWAQDLGKDFSHLIKIG